jgi:dTDP-4-dehydrorhamnose reductase
MDQDMSESSRGRILVTGAGGMAGRVLIKTLSGRGFDVVGLSSQARPAEIAEAGWAQLNILDTPALEAFVFKFKPTSIVHAASSVFVNECEKESERAHIYNLHVELTARLTSYAERLNAQLIYISTESVYDGRKAGFYQESDLTHPLNYYALTKLQGEDEVRKWKRGLTLRTNILGWRTDGRLSFLEWVLSGLKSGEKRTMLTDVTFSPITTYQLADDVVGCIETGLAGLYHAGGATSVSKYDVAYRLANRLGLDTNLLVPMTMDQLPMGAPRPANTVLDSSRLAKAIDRPRPTIDESIERFIAKK